MRARDAHPARLRVQAGRERPQRVDAAADPVLCLQHDGPVPCALELVRGDQAAQAAADDHHVPRRACRWARTARTRDDEHVRHAR